MNTKHDPFAAFNAAHLKALLKARAERHGMMKHDHAAQAARITTTHTPQQVRQIIRILRRAK